MMNAMPGRTPGSIRLLFGAIAHFLLFCLVVTLTGVALAFISEGVWIVGVMLLTMVALVGIWMTYA